MQVYLDHSATTPVLPEVAQVMQEIMVHEFGNPSSLHAMGVRAERHLDKTRQILAQACAVRAEEIIFTSGGTEANNLAIKGVARRLKRRGNHLMTTQVEHPSVLYAYKALEEEGFAVTYLPVDRNGQVDVADVVANLRPDTLLVSIMHVNNEVGTIMPVAEIGRALKAKNAHTLFHVDAVQSFGKLAVEPQRWQADLVTFSAHKIHGPKGCGALYCRKGVLLAPLLHGGDQERGLRPGTENVAAIAGFGRAALLALAERESKMEKIAGLKKLLCEGICRQIPEVTINSPPNGAPHILNVTFAGVKGEVLVHALAEAGIYVSTGSACHSHRADPSHVLLAMQRKPEEIEATLRFSFSAYNTEAEIEYTLEKLRHAVETLRMLTRRKK
ncbi:MAG: cysteine desulfurase [Firmicutes bacterium]|nr:cysteine desulfurase [Bacillota bacterium]